MAQECGCGGVAGDSKAQLRVLTLALALNALMFGVGLVAGLAGRSSSLIADALDMLADAGAYTIALLAIGRSARFKANARILSGSVLLVLGLGVLCDVVRRGLGPHHPEGGLMIGVATLSLAVNATVLALLGRVRNEGVHLRATWIFTRADVVANAAVITSGVLVLLTRWLFLDLLVGAAIGVYVLKEALEILGEARRAGAEARA